ncbi:MAG: transcriptional regulator GcvA [Pseudomonadota bacterium]
MMRSNLPLNALRAFEAAARHLSFKAAGAELHVTPAAISQQIKVLEDQVGTPLFIRLTRALQLTQAGQEALPLVTQALDGLEEATSRMTHHARAHSLTISVSPSFGAMWLVPRLERFYAKHPQIDIRIDGTDRRVDIARGEADLAIRYGAGGYGGVQVDHLFDQRNTPVCSPDLLHGMAPLGHQDDLRHHTLLHVIWKEADASWRMWLTAAGVTGVDAAKGPQFSQESMAVEAALEGQGVALLGDRLVADHLASGRLVCPFGDDLRPQLDFAYYLLSREGGPKADEVSAFRDWILQEARQALPGSSTASKSVLV